jgi:hypothetical protein
MRTRGASKHPRAGEVERAKLDTRAKTTAKVRRNKRPTTRAVLVLGQSLGCSDPQGSIARAIVVPYNVLELYGVATRLDDAVGIIIDVFLVDRNTPTLVLQGSVGKCSTPKHARGRKATTSGPIHSQQQ